MSAGTGVVHSEMNDGDKTCRFLQVGWVGVVLGWGGRVGRLRTLCWPPPAPPSYILDLAHNRLIPDLSPAWQ